MKQLLAALLLLVMTGPSAAFSGNDWLEWSGHTRVAYLSGALTMLGLWRRLTEKRPLAICEPPAATTGQMAAIVSRYLSERPQDRHYGISVVMAMALAEAFPCDAEGAS